MSRILLACHGGGSSEGAVRVAKALSVRTGCDIEVIAVLPPPSPTDYGYGPVFIPDAETEELLEHKLLDDVQRQLARCGLGMLRARLMVGTPASAIAEAALASGASLIVVGLGPHHFADRALGGETALQLAQVASTPVLAVPGGAARVHPDDVVATGTGRPSTSARRSWTVGEVASSGRRSADTSAGRRVNVVRPGDRTARS